MSALHTDERLTLFLEVSPVMDDDLRRIRVAAANKESLEFELDSAALALEEAITAAAGDGQDVDRIADAAEVPVEDVIKLANPPHLPGPDTR